MNLVPQRQEKSTFTPSPYRLEDWHIRVLIFAIMEAWRRICASNPNILDEKEPLTTIDLCDALAQIQSEELIAGFTQETFETPDPNPQRRSAKGSELESRSNDFILRPSGYFPGGNKRKYGFVVESKRLQNPRYGLDKYIEDGMHRFIHEGDYAEYMEHAMMLAYTDGSYAAPSALLNYFATCGSLKKSKEKIAKIERCAPKATLEIDKFSDIFTTTHCRSFRLPNGHNPGPIELYHLWLDGMAPAVKKGYDMHRCLKSRQLQL